MITLPKPRATSTVASDPTLTPLSSQNLVHRVPVPCPAIRALHRSLLIFAFLLVSIIQYPFACFALRDLISFAFIFVLHINRDMVQSHPTQDLSPPLPPPSSHQPF